MTPRSACHTSFLTHSSHARGLPCAIVDPKEFRRAPSRPSPAPRATRRRGRDAIASCNPSSIGAVTGAKPTSHRVLGIGYVVSGEKTKRRPRRIPDKSPLVIWRNCPERHLALSSFYRISPFRGALISKAPGPVKDSPPVCPPFAHASLDPWRARRQKNQGGLGLPLPKPVTPLVTPAGPARERNQGPPESL